MVKSKLSRSRRGEYTLTLSGLKKEHVQLLYSIFSNITLHRCKGIVDLGLQGSPLPFECLETLVPIDFCVRGEPTSLGCTQHKALRDLLSAFPCSIDNIPPREFFYNLKTFEPL